MLSKPNYFLGEIPFDKVWLKNKEWYENNQVTFLAGKTASSVNASEGQVGLSDGSQISYVKLLISTGMKTRKWSVDGSAKKGIYYLRTLEDGKAIIEAVKSKKKALIIGGGFISFEMADMLRLAGLDVSVILRENYFWEPLLDEPSGRMIEKAIKKADVNIVYNSEVRQVLGKNEVSGVELNNGNKIECDMIMCGIGVVCENMWLVDSEIDINKGIIANEFLETNISNIWAAGDCAEFKDVVLDEVIQIGNWVNAREQGRIAGLNMVGNKTAFNFVSFYTTQGMGITIAFVGDIRLKEDRQVIKRGSPETDSYGRIIVLNKGARIEMEGATLINRTGEMATIAKIIGNNLDVSGRLEEIGDVNYDLKRLIENT